MWQLQELARFRAVYEHGSLSAAARALGLSQPALSRSLQRLEQRAGAPLFQRHTRSLRATELADTLHRQVTRILDEAAGLDRLVEAFHDGRSGLVRIGCGPFVPDLLTERLAGPLQRSRATMDAGVRLEIHSDHFESLCEGLYAYRYDFLVYDGRQRSALPDRDDVEELPLLQLPLEVVAPASWLVGKDAAAAGDGDAALAFMADRPWALPRVAPEYRRQIAPWFRELLVARRGAEFQMATISSCLALCRAGRAVTVAPRSLIEDDLNAGRLKVLPLDAGVTVSACAYRLRSHPLSQAASEVWRLLKRGALARAG
ncbi:MAG TPA: LysR family transcriptional regulator [Alcanivorax sp.]|nr:LysR family transcriptional regulator [Alcanivorax sp.]